MAALQGANMVGADTRCSVNGTSSLFAFVKVSQPNDPYGSPSFLVSVKTHNNAGIEPIDTLQTLFDQVKSCNATAIQPSAEVASLRVFPNPVHDRLTVEWEGAGSNPFEVQILDAMGRVVLRMECFPQQTISIGQLARGLYRLQVVDGENKQGITLIKN
jgi:hypothetical protein